MGMGPQSGEHCCNNYDQKKTSKRVDFSICYGQYVQVFAVKNIESYYKNRARKCIFPIHKLAHLVLPHFLNIKKSWSGVK